MEDWLGSYLVEGFCIVEIDICNFIYTYIYIIYIHILDPAPTCNSPKMGLLK